MSASWRGRSASWCAAIGLVVLAGACRSAKEVPLEVDLSVDSACSQALPCAGEISVELIDDATHASLQRRCIPFDQQAGRTAQTLPALLADAGTLVVPGAEAVRLAVSVISPPSSTPCPATPEQVPVLRGESEPLHASASQTHVPLTLSCAERPGGLLPPPIRASCGPVLHADPSTIESTVASAPHGATVRLAAGTYDGEIELRAHGTADEPITVEPEPGAHVLFQGPSAELPSLWIYQSTGLRIRGLEVVSLPQTGGSGVQIEDSIDITLEANDLHDTGHACLAVKGSGGALSERIQLRGNRLHRCGAHWVSRDPIWYVGDYAAHLGQEDSSSDGGTELGVKDALFVNNLIFDMPYGNGILIGPEAVDVVVTHNTLAGLTWSGNAQNTCLACAGKGVDFFGHYMRWQPQGSVVVNNVFATLTQSAVSGNSGGNYPGADGGALMATNQVFQNATWQVGSPPFKTSDNGNVLFTLGTNLTEADVRFRDAGAFDFRPSAGSPLVGTADQDYSPMFDQAGVYRATPSVGALEP